MSGTGLVLQDNGDNLSVSANGSFTFSTTVSSGTTYSVTVKTQPSSPMQTCTIVNGSGTVGRFSVTSVAVTCLNTVARYGFVADFADNAVLSYMADSATGRLRYIGKAPAGTNPRSVAVDSTGKYAYAINRTGNTISQYTIGTDGSLTSVASPVATDAGPYAITVDPSSKYVYVANYGAATISQYTIGTTGRLTPMSTPTVASGSNPQAVTVDPSGKYAYTANWGTGR